MAIHKSTRHPKIIGDLGEMLLSNWLSRSGFEVAVVGHTGIDLIPYNPKTGERLGITVKSRTRTRGQESVSVTVFKDKSERTKLFAACKYFGCQPWVAVYVEVENSADLYLTPLQHYEQKLRGGKQKNLFDWSMSLERKKQYGYDPLVKHVRINFDHTRWMTTQKVL